MTKEGMWLCTGKQAEDKGLVGCPPNPMQCGLSLYKDWSGLTPVNINLLSPQGHIKPRALWQLLHQYTHKCLNSFSFSCSGTCSAVSGVFSVSNATLLPGRSPGPLGLGMGWGGGFRTPLGRGNGNEISTLPYGPSFSPKAGPSSSKMRFVF